MITLALAGLLAGGLHVFAGPDHVGSMVPLAIERQRPAWRIGLAWGLGHAATTLVFGLFIGLGRQALPIVLPAETSERVTGTLLLLLGTWGAARAWRRSRAQRVALAAAPVADAAATPITPPSETAPASTPFAGASFGLGLVHGLFGLSHLALIIPLLAIDRLSESLLYIAMFAIGSTVAMTSVCALIGAASSHLSTRSRRLGDTLLAASSVALGALGVHLLLF